MMHFDQIETIGRYRFDLFEHESLLHGVFTRNGGVSPEPWNSLNLGGLNGDSRENVIENRRRIFAAMGRPVESIFDVWQVHGTDVVCANKPRSLNETHQKADAILTDNPEITLFMRFADCVPLFLFDPVKSVVGLAHAGWQGTVKKIGAVTVKAMQDNYGCKPEDITAAIGPSICVTHYPVGKDVIAQVKSAFSGSSDNLLKQKGEAVHFDLWEANRLCFLQAGVKKIEIGGLCTACNTSEWFSHRAEMGKTGRFGAMIALENED